MTKYLIPFALVALAWLWVSQCHDPIVEQRALQEQQDKRDDSTHRANDLWKAHFAQREIQRESLLAITERRLQVSRGETARLKAKIPQGGRLAEPQPAPLHADQPVGKTAGKAEPAPPVGCAGTPAACDTIISWQDSALAAQGEELTLWQAMVGDRDVRIHQLETENAALLISRAAWKKQSHKHFGCAGGPSVTATISGHVSAGFGASCGILF